MYNIIVHVQRGGLYMENNFFKVRIKKLRTDNNLSMDALAEKLETKKSTISMWENNGVIPREEMLLKISKFFNVSIDYLLGNDYMEGKKPDDSKLLYLQRNLEKLDNERLSKAETILKTVFTDIFEDDEGEDDDRF